MATQQQGNSNVVTRSMGYDNPTYLTRQSYAMALTSAGSAQTTGKFFAWTQLTLCGVTFNVGAIGTSTYTVNGTATTSCGSYYALFVANTNTTGTAVSLATTTLGAAATGPFYIGGTGAAGTNVNVPGVGGVGGYWRYSFNTLGGTNTTQAWGTATYSLGMPGGGQTSGGVYMNPGDYITFIGGTDATFTTVPVIEYSVAAPNGVVMA